MTAIITMMVYTLLQTVELAVVKACLYACSIRESQWILVMNGLKRANSVVWQGFEICMLLRAASNENITTPYENGFEAEAWMETKEIWLVDLMLGVCVCMCEEKRKCM